MELSRMLRGLAAELLDAADELDVEEVAAPEEVEILEDAAEAFEPAADDSEADLDSGRAADDDE